MALLKISYPTTEAAIKEAKHWLNNTSMAYGMMGNKERAAGIDDALRCLNIFLKRVKK